MSELNVRVATQIFINLTGLPRPLKWPGNDGFLWISLAIATSNGYIYDEVL